MFIYLKTQGDEKILGGETERKMNREKRVDNGGQSPDDTDTKKL